MMDTILAELVALTELSRTSEAIAAGSALPRLAIRLPPLRRQEIMQRTV